MRHVQIRDLCNQKEIREGRVEVIKIPGHSNPADLLTKVLSTEEIRTKLGAMNLRIV